MRTSYKTKMARRLRTREELVAGVPIFGTKGWLRRKWYIADRVKRQQARASYLAKVKKERKNG